MSDERDITPNRERQLRAREELERKLLEGVNSGPATLMTEKDWNELRAALIVRCARDK